MSRAILREGMGDANWVYVMHDEGQDLLRAAQASGIRTAVDVFMHPGTYRLLRDEHFRFPSWPCAAPDENTIRDTEEYLIGSLRLADLITCPSNWVRSGVVELLPEAGGKIALLPYGTDIKVAASGKCIPGRILFAGNDPLRKGLHYLGAAASRLRKMGRTYEFRVAGDIGREVQDHPVCQGLVFTGKLPSEQMVKEFSAADVFVLPTLSEGFASVVIEAMSQGVPVVTTANAGTEITSGVNGILVPAKSSEAIVSAIERVVQDRAFRSQLSANSAAFATQHYSISAWSCRLARAFTGIGSSRLSPVKA